MSYPKPLKETAHITCPGCWCNTLAQTVAAPTYALGGVAWYQCTSCSWAGSTEDLRRPTDQAEILQCMREDQQRGEPGSSGSGNSRRKPVAWVRGESRTAWDDGLTRQVQRVGPSKDKVLRWGQWTLRVTAQEWDALLEIAGGRYPEALRPHVSRVLGGNPGSVTEVKAAFRLLLVEFFS